MKKNIVRMIAFILCIPVMYSVSAEEITESDAGIETQGAEVEVYVAVDITNDFLDPNFRQYVIDTYGASGKVLDTDISSVQFLDLTGLGIQDLSGIEHFVAATNINLDENNLGDVSLTDFPVSMTTLQMINSNVTSINTVGGENITQFVISGNPLSSIDLSLMTSLLYFNADEMTPSFSEIDFSGALSLERISLNTTSIAKVDLSMLGNLDSISIMDSSVSELILPEYIISKNLQEFNLARTQLEFVNAVPLAAMEWLTHELSPLKEVKINAEGYPYIELHENSVIENLDELNLDGEKFVYDATVSTLTWTASTNANDFVAQYNQGIQFSNDDDSVLEQTEFYRYPFTGTYRLVWIEPSEVYPLLPIPPRGTLTYEVNFMDCNNNLVKQEWVEEGMDATAPSEYNYDLSLTTNVTSAKELNPLNCSSGYVVPKTGR